MRRSALANVFVSILLGILGLSMGWYVWATWQKEAMLPFALTSMGLSVIHLLTSSFILYLSLLSDETLPRPEEKAHSKKDRMKSTAISVLLLLLCLYIYTVPGRVSFPRGIWAARWIPWLLSVIIYVAGSYFLVSLILLILAVCGKDVEIARSGTEKEDRLT